MQNLAGNADCDRIIERELIRCRIVPVRGERTTGEVAYSITGKLGAFAFRRAWYYWVVDGRVPIAVAEELYADPVGREDVRAAGHCMCPPPREWAKWFDDTGNELVPMDQKAECERYAEKYPHFREKMARVRFVEDPSGGNGFVMTYHIDSEVGLRLFADAIRAHGLDNGDRP